ncbi:MAG: hypothetical protein ABGX44_03140 [Candidatus Poseidoniia archaeon]
MALPPLWYALFVIVSFLGIATWYLKNFSNKVNLMRFCGLLGSACMASLAIWTWQMEI